MNLAQELYAELAGTTGLKAQPDWPEAIAAAIEAVPLTDYSTKALGESEYRARVMAEVARRVTVPETHFFRNHAQLAHCAEHVERVTSTQNRVGTLWCAGSATGEEPYTIAMLLFRMHGTSVRSRCELTANDINPEAVKKARAATYTSWSFRGAPGWCFSHFTSMEGGALRLTRPEVVEAVQFVVESCQAAAHRRKSESVDVIMFRNVAIYLEDRAIRHLHDEFARVLRRGGLLAMGPSDPRPQGSAFEFVGYFDDSPVFRRADDAVDAQVPAPALPKVSAPTRAPTRAPTKKREAVLANPTTSASQAIEKAPTSDSAIRVIKHLTEGAPEDPLAHRILGQMHLERGETEQAVSVLRQAVFLSATDVLARYFLALALREAGDVRSANRQLANVQEELRARPDDELLEDQSTQVGELRASARFLEGEWK